MQETGNSKIRSTRVTLRIGDNTLSFAVVDDTATNQIRYMPYTIKSGISMAANLREAFKSDETNLSGYDRALLMVSTPLLMIPVEEYQEQERATLYNHAFPGHENSAIQASILPSLNAVAVFSVNKDLKLVIDDHFSDVKIIPLMQPIWNYFHQRSFTGNRRKLYGYFHGKKLDIVSFDKNRFKFCNSFEAAHSRDAAYFLLYVWKQLAMDAEKDELHIAGDIPDREWLTEALHRYLKKAYIINPVADFNRAPVTQIKGMTLDMMTLFIKGR